MSETIQLPSATNSLLDNIWGVEPAQPQVQQQPAEAQTQQTTPIQEPPATTPTTQEPPKTETVDYNQWVKTEFGFDTVEAAKQEFERVKNWKPEEPKLKTVEELFGEKEKEISDYLLNKQKIERLSSAQLENNTSVASEIIKLSMRQKNNELTDEDADFLFNQRFATPNKPVYNEAQETEDEYNGRVSQWQEQVNTIQKQMIIEAKMAKPELEKLKTELKLPEIYQPQPQTAQPDQAELDRLKAVREGYISTLNEDYSKFEGFNAPYKDEEVEFTVPYTISDEEKTTLKAELENFDSDAFFDQRWFTKEGKPNVNQMMADLYLLKNRDRIFQKIANEAGSQRLLQKTKQLSNVNVNGNGQTTFSPQEPDKQKQLLDSIWGVTSN